MQTVGYVYPGIDIEGSVEMKSKVIVALDFSSEQQVMDFVDRLSPDMCGLKVGKELFTKLGPRPVEVIIKKGFAVFLDLKFHDIPNTVERACAAARDLGVWMVNVHALGGADMMQSARIGLGATSDRPLLTAVTVLTSMDSAALSAVGLDATPEELVKRLARLAQSSGVDGVVCSANEVRELTTILGDEFIKVTPGIRPAGVPNNDQKRVMSPSKAIEEGASYLVIGRPITQARDPVGALTQVLEDIAGGV